MYYNNIASVCLYIRLRSGDTLYLYLAPDCCLDEAYTLWSHMRTHIAYAMLSAKHELRAYPQSVDQSCWTYMPH